MDSLYKGHSYQRVVPHNFDIFFAHFSIFHIFLFVFFKSVELNELDYFVSEELHE